jgi:hypothetical protein
MAFAGSYDGQWLPVNSDSEWPSSSHSSSAMCGANGATSTTSGSTSPRFTLRLPSRTAFRYSIIAAMAVL